MKEYIRQFVAKRVLDILRRKTQNTTVSIRRVEIQHGLVRVYGKRAGQMVDNDFLVRFGLTVNSRSWRACLKLEYADVDWIPFGLDENVINTALTKAIRNNERIKYSSAGRQLDVCIGDVMSMVKKWFVCVFVMIVVIGVLPCVFTGLTTVGLLLCGCLVVVIESFLCSAYFSLRKFIAGGF